MTPQHPSDLLFAVLGVQLGYLAPEDVLASARELGQTGEQRSLCDFLVARGILDKARAQVLERLADRAATAGGGDATQTLELLPAAVKELARRTSDAEVSSPGTRAPPRSGLVEEQAHRYFAAPRADAPPEELGRGDSTRVLAMHDTVLGRDVAWKQPLDPGAASDDALAAQVRLLAKLDHPAVVPVYELGRASSGPVYATLRKVSGRSLAEALTRAGTVEERLSLLGAVHTIARCLADAHEAGVTHRRLTCRSISLGSFGEVYLLGWGPPEPELTPEAAQAADVKALGAVLHEVVTGLPVPVMGEVRARGVPEDLVGLCRATLGGQVPSAEQFASELKAFIDGRRLAGYHYSSWQLLKRWVARHRIYTAMLVFGVLLVTGLAGNAAAQVRAERDRARLFARRFLDDVALRLRAQPGVEPLLEQVTTAALAHYQRTTDLQSAPREERLRVARAMARLGAVSRSLGRADEAKQSLDFADVLASGLAAKSEADAEARVVLAQSAATRAQLPGVAPAEVQQLASRARQLADAAVALLPGSLEARRAAATARLLGVGGDADAARVAADLDEAVKLLEAPSSVPAEELVRREALGAALVTRLDWRAHAGPGAGEPEARAVVEQLAALRERALDDLELQLLAARAALLHAEALERTGAAADAASQAAAAAKLARDVVSRRQDRQDAALLQVEGTLRAGKAAEALAQARALDARGVSAVAPLLAEAALLSGQLELARTHPVKAPSPAVVLVRALAAAWQDRPSDAVIQARALRATLARVGWPPGRLAHALEALPVGGAAGEAAVRRFAAQWRDGGPDAALADFVATLEAALPKK